LCFGSISWYILAARNPKNDIRGFFALLLLALFKSRRILTNVREADEVAKYIVLLPYFVVRMVYFVAAIIFGRSLRGCSVPISSDFTFNPTAIISWIR